MVFTFIFFLHLVACCILKVKSQTFDLTFFQQMSNMHVNQVVSILLAGWRVIFLFVKNIVRSCFSSALSLSLSSFILAPVLDHSFGISSFVIIKLGQQNHTPAKLNDGLWKSYINEIVLAVYFLGYS